MGTTSFEEALERLDSIVRHLEGGELSLDESLARFEEGIGLVRFCREKLAAVEERLQLLTEQADGSAVCHAWKGHSTDAGAKDNAS